jgi:hypothetical protein
MKQNKNKNRQSRNALNKIPRPELMHEARVRITCGVNFTVSNLTASPAGGAIVLDTSAIPNFTTRFGMTFINYRILGIKLTMVPAIPQTSITAANPGYSAFSLYYNASGSTPGAPLSFSQVLELPQSKLIMSPGPGGFNGTYVPRTFTWRNQNLNEAVWSSTVGPPLLGNVFLLYYEPSGAFFNVFGSYDMEFRGIAEV